VGLLLAAVLANAAVAAAESPHGRLPTLVNASQIHGLTSEQAARGYPVRLRVIVTYYDCYLDPAHPNFFVSDETGAIFVIQASNRDLHLHPGEVIEVSGVTGPGNFAPIVDHATVRLLGSSPLPDRAIHVTRGQLLTGRYDAQWVSVEGIVHSAKDFGDLHKDVILKIASSDGLISAVTVKDPVTNYDALIDARVMIHANAASLFNRNRQMVGVRLLFPGPDAVKILEGALLDPFRLPTLSVSDLLRYSPGVPVGHRVHVRGPVTLQWPGRSVCIQAGESGLCVDTAQVQPLSEGEVVDVIGFPTVGGLNPILTDALVRSTGTWQPVSPSLITAAQALSGSHDSRLVRIEGKLIGRDRGAQDPTIILSLDNFLFPVLLQQLDLNHAIPDWSPGSTLRITGICSVRVGDAEVVREGFATPASFRILLRSPRDVVVLRKASWWTAAHLLPLLALALAATLCVLAWVALLRNRIQEQTKLIEKQNVTLRGLSFLDGLTNVANRRRFDETLRTEFRRVLETSTQISLLMIDIDHFKALNDMYGHQSGDECLIRVAKALGSPTLRSTDLLARYGGEEFAVIMPLCDEKGALVIGERLRIAVNGLSNIDANLPFNPQLSVSVGAATMRPSDGIRNMKALIALADWALYQSKQQGRNCVTGATVVPMTLESANRT
jgi:diguanylate cyclase (GGDEF)-like protein